MSAFTAADTLHRLVKQALDSGEVASVAEAKALFAGYRVALRLEEAEARDPHNQAALLTAIALARRVFLGGVTVVAPANLPLLAPLPLGRTLGEAVVAAPPRPRQSAFHVRMLFSGWRGGIVPAHIEALPPPGPVMALAPMLAAAFAINEAFLFVSGQNEIAGRRSVGLSLWDPSPVCDWLATAAEPGLCLLPSRLWLIGLGHLGQAYLWALGLLPYAEPAQLGLVLQDVDIITPSTESTSILSNATLIGQKKTRSMAAWAERRGFSTVIQERLFNKNFTRQASEPALALCGLDNGLGRQALDQVGFDFVVEAGLGRGYQDFRAVQLHTLPASRPAAQIWQTDHDREQIEDRPAYKRMLNNGELDRCGITLLAGKAVGAPFVGAVAATLAVAEVLRLLQGGCIHQLIDLDLKSPEYRNTVPTSQDFSAINPGYVMASG